MRYLSAEDILLLHALLIDETGGSHGVRDVQLLQSIAKKPQMRFAGKQLYANVLAQAAVLLEAIANYHVFIDGNKRTAFVAAARFLHLNGYEIQSSNKGVEKEMLKVATGKMSVKDIELWLKKHSTRMPRKRT